MNTAFVPNDAAYEMTPAAQLEAANDWRKLQGKRPLKSLKVNPMESHRVLLRPIDAVGAAHVRACGHRFDPRNEPRFANCQACWTVYFLMNPIVLQAAAKLAEAFGQLAVKKEKGKKFYRAFIQFVEEKEREAAAKFKSEQPVAEEAVA